MQENKLKTLYNRLFNGKYSNYGFALLAVVAICLFLGRGYFQKEGKGQDYVTIRSLVEKSLGGDPLPKESLEHAKHILDLHPELHATYDPLIILNVAATGDQALATELADLAITRGSSLVLPHYLDFAKNSLLLMKNDTAAAFTAAEKLENALQKETSSSFETLRAINLLRLAFLAKKLHNPDLQKDYLARFESLKNSATLGALFQEGSFTLKDYFAAAEA